VGEILPFRPRIGVRRMPPMTTLPVVPQPIPQIPRTKAARAKRMRVLWKLIRCRDCIGACLWWCASEPGHTQKRHSAAENRLLEMRARESLRRKDPVKLRAIELAEVEYWLLWEIEQKPKRSA
jgi:hypothetical protein